MFLFIDQEIYVKELDEYGPLNYTKYVATVSAPEGGASYRVVPVLKTTLRKILFLGAYAVYTDISFYPPYYGQYNFGKRAIIKTFLYRFSDMLIRFP